MVRTELNNNRRLKRVPTDVTGSQPGRAVYTPCTITTPDRGYGALRPQRARPSASHSADTASPPCSQRDEHLIAQPLPVEVPLVAILRAQQKPVICGHRPVEVVAMHDGDLSRASETLAKFSGER
jgi:hypothetical protein